MVQDNMKVATAIVLIAFSASLLADKSIFSMDIDCDGIAENVTLEISEQNFVVSVVTSSNGKSTSLTFGLDQPSRQDAICGTSPMLSARTAETEEGHINMFGEIVDGYNYSPACKELIVSGGDCDPIHVFFDHKRDTLNWLRP